MNRKQHETRHYVAASFRLLTGLDFLYQCGGNVDRASLFTRSAGRENGGRWTTNRSSNTDRNPVVRYAYGQRCGLGFDLSTTRLPR